MNIAQTRQVLSYLWATHPSAPKYTDEDKIRTVASYFRVLYPYSVDDVLDAVDRVCRAKPAFMPSAYEIERHCVKTPDVDRFLSQEYRELDNQYQEYAGCGFNDLYSERAKLDQLPADCPESGKIRARIEGIKQRMMIEEKLFYLYHEAEKRAVIAYDEQQRQIAKSDLISIGYARLALEG